MEIFHSLQVIRHNEKNCNTAQKHGNRLIKWKRKFTSNLRYVKNLIFKSSLSIGLYRQCIGKEELKLF